MNRITIILTLTILVSLQGCGQKQATDIQTKKNDISDYTQSFISIDSPRIALSNVKIIDGTGNPSRNSQTVLIENGIIVDIVDSKDIEITNGFHEMDLSGRTIIPGIIGMHNHMRIPESAMLSTSPKLYLACGVTTIQTCGTGNPYEEIAIAKSIDRGEQPGPEIINSGPYLTGLNIGPDKA